MQRRRGPSETVKALRASPQCRGVRLMKGSQAWLLPRGSLAAVKKQLGR